MPVFRAAAASAFLCLWLGLCGGANAQQKIEPAPEAASGRSENPLVTARHAMVVTAAPQATQAALEILKDGGSAVDAMIAAQLVLGLVEPQSSGLGGGSFLVHFDAASAKVSTLDGRETAPAAAKPDMFLDAAGQPMDFLDAVVGGRSVGTPGTVALLEAAHQKHGKLPWARLFDPAIALAKQGFVVSSRLNSLISDSAESLYRQREAREYFLSEEGVPLFAGAKRQNLAYAQTLEAIAANGAKAFYEGEIARAVVAAVTGDPEKPGLISEQDLASYKAVEREPVCSPYRQWTVCGMGPPSSGAIAIGQILAMLEVTGLSAGKNDDPQNWRLIGDASRLAFADREAFVADPAFVVQPKGLLNKDYLRARAGLLSGNKALPPESVVAGEPPFDHASAHPQAHPAGLTPELPSTSHLCIVDASGNVVSMTSTIENGFGSRLMVRGFLLNNELTDFSFVAQKNGKPVANRVEPGKRPRSSMAPTIVLLDGKPVLAIGSPGGSRIINFVTQALIAHLDWGMDVQAAVSMPHLANRFGLFELESGTGAEAMAAGLEGLGYQSEPVELNSGLGAIAIYRDRLEGAADPRREGQAAGY